MPVYKENLFNSNASTVNVSVLYTIELFRIQTNEKCNDVQGLHSSLVILILSNLQPDPVRTKRQKIASKNAEQSKRSTNLAKMIKERYRKVCMVLI